MRNARRELTHTRQFFTLHELILGQLQLFQRGPQPVVALLQFFGPLADASLEHLVLVSRHFLVQPTDPQLLLPRLRRFFLELVDAVAQGNGQQDHFYDAPHWHGKVDVHQPFGLKSTRELTSRKQEHREQEESEGDEQIQRRALPLFPHVDGRWYDQQRRQSHQVDRLEGPIQSTNQQEHQRQAVQRHQRIEKLEIGGAFSCQIQEPIDKQDGGHP